MGTTPQPSLAAKLWSKNPYAGEKFSLTHTPSSAFPLSYWYNWTNWTAPSSTKSTIFIPPPSPPTSISARTPPPNLNQRAYPPPPNLNQRAYEALVEEGFSVVPYHKDTVPLERLANLHALRTGRAKILVCTDLAAR